MKANELGIDLQTVALAHKDGNVLISSNDIQTTADLKDKTYAIPHKFSSHNILLNEMLKKNGMSYDDVNVVEMTPAEMPAALSENRIAGYVITNRSEQLQLLWKKEKCMLIPMKYGQILIAVLSYYTPILFGNNKEVVQSFVNEYVALGKQADDRDIQPASRRRAQPGGRRHTKRRQTISGCRQR